MKKSIEEIYQIYLKHPNISKDSRQIQKDCIYLALSGENFNGNQFAEDALQKGAAYAIVDQKEYCKNDHYLLVDDGLKALQALARYHRKSLNIPIIGITGSNGKTTTKEMISRVLASHYSTFSTAGNYNNHIGVPLSILNIRDDHEMAVIEMGANHQGEIEFLCDIADPNYGMITNIGKAHLEGFGGIEGVKKGKSELYKHLEANAGLIFLNADDPVLIELSQQNKIYTYGTSIDCKCSARLNQAQPYLKGSWLTKDQAGEIDAKIYGSYNFYNMLAAICIGDYFKVPAAKIDQAINSYEANNNRSEIKQMHGSTLYLDAYNANPSSMKVALDNFSDLDVDADKKLAILGDMFEMGEDSLKEHSNFIEYALEKQIGQLVFVGKNFQGAKERLAYDLKVFTTTEEAKAWFVGQKKEGLHILIKGSRGMALEKLLATD